MAKRIKDAVVSHVQTELDELQSDQGLPFRKLLDEKRIIAALERAGIKFRKRIFEPLTTLDAFLSQAVASKDSTCEDAVSRVIAYRLACHQPACSADTSSYCTARGRLPEKILQELACETGQELHCDAKPVWLWKGRHVVIVDGSTAELADTPENQAEYPQSRRQKPGLGFPMLRMVVLLSLAVGTVLECAIGPCRGKKTGEQSLFRRIQGTLKPGSILLGDRLYDAYRDMATLKKCGVDSVFGKRPSRRCDFRKGRRLGKNDHVVTVKKPKYDKNRFESKEEWAALPDDMELRETQKTVRRKGFKTRVVIIVSTLIEGDLYSAADLLELFGMRWHCELDLRSLKQSLGIRRLHCKTPGMVRKELWVKLRAYNLIRVRMAQAAAVHDCQPRRLSFTAGKTHIHNFSVYLKTASPAERDRLEGELLKAIATSYIEPRPDRKEPRAVKKRQQKYSYLTKPRTEARKGLTA